MEKQLNIIKQSTHRDTHTCTQTWRGQGGLAAVLRKGAFPLEVARLDQRSRRRWAVFASRQQRVSRQPSQRIRGREWTRWILQRCPCTCDRVGDTAAHSSHPLPSDGRERRTELAETARRRLCLGTPRTCWRHGRHRAFLAVPRTPRRRVDAHGCAVLSLPPRPDLSKQCSLKKVTFFGATNPKTSGHEQAAAQVHGAPCWRAVHKRTD